MKKLRIALYIMLVVVIGIALLYLSLDTASTLLEPLWDEVYTGSGLTISGTVIYSDGREFILDVLREDAPTLRAPSLYIVGDNTKIWQKNRWQKLKKAPEVGTVLMMHVPFKQEPTGIFIDQNYEYIKGDVEVYTASNITIGKREFGLGSAYIDNKAKGKELGAFAVLSIIDGKTEYAEIWPSEIKDLPTIIRNSRDIWKREGFIPADIEIGFSNGIIITGFQHPFKNQLNKVKRHIYSLDGILINSEEFLPLDELEMQVQFRDVVYSSTWESKNLKELNIEEKTLQIAGKDYTGETYLYVNGLHQFLYTRSWQEGSYTVWKEVIVDDGDSSSKQPN